VARGETTAPSEVAGRANAEAADDAKTVRAVIVFNQEDMAKNGLYVEIKDVEYIFRNGTKKLRMQNE